MRDFVFPKNNEESFITIAERLGYKELVFVYSFNKNAIEHIRNRIDKFKQKTNLSLFFGILAEKSLLQKAKTHSGLILYKSDGNDRYVFDKIKNCIVFGLEEVGRKDVMHFRNSGLNQVLCRIANKNNISIGFSFSMLLRSNPVTRSKLLGRMMQNIRLCRKYDVRPIFASFAETPYEMRAPKDMESFGRLMGISCK